MKAEKIILIIVFINSVNSKQNLQLVWSDEFDDKGLDPNKWQVEDEWLTGNCRGNHIGQLNCNVNQSENLQSRDGCLAITATRHKKKGFNKEYNSAKITTRQSWTYGRFEIRAALPTGKMLRPALYMSPMNSGQWALTGQIDIMTNIQTQSFGNGVHFSASPSIYKPDNYEYFTNASLNDFHTYAIEWSESRIDWFFDRNNHLSFKLSEKLAPIYTKSGQPFDKPFKLVILLGVGGIFFPNQVLELSDFYDWECSALILDYIRVYQWTDNQVVHSFNNTDDRTSSLDICLDVMSSVKPAKPLNIPFSTIVSIIISLILLIIIPVLIYLYMRQKKLMEVNRRTNSGVYDDTYPEVYYDNYKTEGEDVNTYEMPENYYSKTINDPDLNYLALTDKSSQRNLSYLSINSSNKS